MHVGVTKVTEYLFNEFYKDSEEEYTCPPCDSDEYSGTLYRYMKNKDVITEKDYKFSLERSGFRKRYSEDFKTLCQGGGLSSFLTEEAADLNFEKSKKNSIVMKNFKGLYKIEISKLDGVIKHTPNKNNREHYTWWHKKDTDYLSKSYFIKNY